MKLGLTSARLATRKARLGGSAARILMSGNPEAIFRLYQEMRGEREPDDFSDVLEAQLGLWTEEFNRLWFMRHTGRKVTNAGDAFDHPAYPFLSCTLDGKTTAADETPAIFEAKHLNPFRFEEREALAKFQPQLQHYMMVNRLMWAVLSMIIGTTQWRFVEVPADPFYQAQLLEREIEFWECVQKGEPLDSFAPVPPPPPVETFVTVDMTGNNRWAGSAADYIETETSARINALAAKTLREMVARDVGLAHGHGVKIKRDGAGRLRLTTEGDQ